MPLTDEQFANRTGKYGGSDMPTIMGMNPYKTPVELWLEHTGRIDPPDLSNNDAVTFGTVLEAPIAEIAAQRLGLKIRQFHKSKFHKKHDYLVCHPDRLIVGKREGMEIKSRSMYARDQYGEANTDQVMDSDYCQVQYCMYMFDYDAWWMAVLFGGQKLETFYVPRNQAFIDAMMEKVQQFHQHVISDTPPPIQSSDDILKLYETIGDDPVIAEDIYVQMVKDINVLQDEIKERQRFVEDKKESLKMKMLDCSLLVDEKGRKIASWKNQSRKVFDQAKWKKENPLMVDRYMTESTTRVFRTHKIKGE